MAKIYGRKPRPLPEYLTDRLAGMGLVLMPNVEPATYRHPLQPNLHLQLVASNVPLNPMITVSFTKGGRPHRMDADAVVALVEFSLGVGVSPNRAMRSSHDSKKGAGRG